MQLKFIFIFSRKTILFISALVIFHHPANLEVIILYVGRCMAKMLTKKTGEKLGIMNKDLLISFKP